MPRIEIELTSSRPDGSWTWRAAGARQPKGTLDGSILPEGAKVGEVVRADVDVDVDGMTVTSVVPTKTKRPDTDRLEIIGPPQRDHPEVTTDRAPRSGRDRDDRGDRGDRDRGDRGDRGPRSDRPRTDRGDRPDRGRTGLGGGDAPRRDRPAGDRGPRGDRPGVDRGPRADRPGVDRGPRADRPGGDRPGVDRGPRADRPGGDRAPGGPPRRERPGPGAGRPPATPRTHPGGERPERARPPRERTMRAPAPPPAPRPRPKRLHPGRTHRDAVLASLPPEEQAIAEHVLRGGVPAVRQAVEEQNAAARVSGVPEVRAEPLVALAEELLPRLRAAEWQDRAEAAIAAGPDVALRDLRALVAGSDAAGRDEANRDLAGRLRQTLEERSTAERDAWLGEIVEALDAGRVVRALRSSCRPPEPGVRFPAELAERLGTAAGEAMGPEVAPDRWVAVLEAVTMSPVRRTVRPRGLPADAPADFLMVARQAVEKVPGLGPLVGAPVGPPPAIGARRPAPPPRPPRPPGGAPPARPAPPAPAPASATAPPATAPSTAEAEADLPAAPPAPSTDEADAEQPAAAPAPSTDPAEAEADLPVAAPAPSTDEADAEQPAAAPARSTAEADLPAAAPAPSTDEADAERPAAAPAPSTDPAVSADGQPAVPGTSADEQGPGEGRSGDDGDDAVLVEELG